MSIDASHRLAPASRAFVSDPCVLGLTPQAFFFHLLRRLSVMRTTRRLYRLSGMIMVFAKTVLYAQLHQMPVLVFPRDRIAGDNLFFPVRASCSTTCRHQ